MFYVLHPPIHISGYAYATDWDYMTIRQFNTQNQQLTGLIFLTSENNQDSRRDSHDDDLSDGGDMGGVLREQDRFLPIANVARIMKKAIPSTVS